MQIEYIKNIHDARYTDNYIFLFYHHAEFLYAFHKIEEILIKRLREISICSHNRTEPVRIERGSRNSLERCCDSRDLSDLERRGRSLHDLQGVLSILQDSRSRCFRRLGARRLRHVQLRPRRWTHEFWNMLLEPATDRHTPS